MLQNTKKAENKESEGVYGMSSILGTLGWYENNGQNGISLAIKSSFEILKASLEKYPIAITGSSMPDKKFMN